tara:strand:+ start:554 stop:1285 length:732 start_codon:yes stop_codon:yes gene_type:complete
MGNTKSKFLNISKKYSFLKKFYYFYNIYIRNYKFLNNGSQFGEDRFILNKFKKNYNGKFLDIGCYHPTKHNNTYLLYKNGWSGINIDLNPLTIELFNFARPRDENLNVAISDEESTRKLYFLDELNTQNTLDNNHLSFLKDHHNIQSSEITEKEIKTKKIDQILTDYNLYNIDFMNIDIEGHEVNVLKKLNFDKFSIKLLCVEMINHNETSKINNKEIDDLLKKNNYKLLEKFDFNYIYEKNK